VRPSEKNEKAVTCKVSIDPLFQRSLFRTKKIYQLLYYYC